MRAIRRASLSPPSALGPAAGGCAAVVEYACAGGPLARFERVGLHSSVSASGSRSDTDGHRFERAADGPGDMEASLCDSDAADESEWRIAKWADDGRRWHGWVSYNRARASRATDWRGGVERERAERGKPFRCDWANRAAPEPPCAQNQSGTVSLKIHAPFTDTIDCTREQ